EKAADAQRTGQAPSGPRGPAQPAAVSVEVTRVGAVQLPETITAVGSLRSDESVTLRPEVAGRITDILFKEGRPVAKGDTLVRLDPSINRAEVRQARANLTLAQGKYERSVDLAGRNFISGQAKDEARNNLEIAASALALAEAKLRKTELKAPFSGIIGLRVVSVGDYVREGADLVTLQAIDPLKVDFRVPETFMKQVQVGQAVEVTLDALPGKTYEGRVFALDPLVDAAGRAIVIRAQVRNQDTMMRPGMFARVTLITRDQREALVLPEEALVPQGTEQFVFRVLDSRASRVKVETGARRDGKVEILAGLNKNDVVVTAGQLKLRDGTLVNVAASGGNGGGAGGGAGGANGGANGPGNGAAGAASGGVNGAGSTPPKGIARSEALSDPQPAGQPVAARSAASRGTAP
ncbi:MAG TPA: efflux RND transporter periplasmic adaptor subunit, partial [Lautropia sp.]|nr:efflux RND transporter periplasmic adaptor subunit [Lautropia sp.]